MVALLKLRAKKPIIEDGGYYISSQVKWKPDGSGFSKFIQHETHLTITAGHLGAEYTVTMSEDEAFEIAAEIIVRRRNRMLQERRAKEDAALKLSRATRVS